MKPLPPAPLPPECGWLCKMRRMTLTGIGKGIAGLASDERGAMAIETAIVAPVLVLLALASFETSTIVSRQHELQSGISEAEAIVLAAGMGAATDTNSLKASLVDSLSLNSDQVTIQTLFRCDDAESLVENKDACSEDDVISTYVRVQLQDDYHPVWKKFGFGQDFHFTVDRTVQTS